MSDAAGQSTQQIADWTGRWQIERRVGELPLYWLGRCEAREGGRVPGVGGLGG